MLFVFLVLLLAPQLYVRLLKDDRVSCFFDESKMVALKMHQVEFFKVAFTGIPDDLDVEALMIEKHRDLFIHKGLNETHFDVVAEHFVGTLQHLGVSQSLIDEAIAVVVLLRPAFAKGAELAKDEEKKDETERVETTEDARSPTSLLMRLGGSVAVRAVVEEFYTRLLDDEELSKFFDNVNMTALRLHQIKFFEIAFSTIPDDMDVPALLKEKHKALFAQGLNATHFDKVVEHFVATLAQLGVSAQLINEAAGIVTPLRVVFEEGAAEAAP